MLSASAFAAVAEVLCTHPIDSAKVRSQTGRSFHRPSSWIYKGVAVRLVGVLPMRMVFWTSMDVFSNHIPYPILSGALAGAAQTVVDTPIESAKIMTMTGGKITSWKQLLRGWQWNVARNAGFAAGVCAGRKWSGDSPMGAAAGAVAGAVITHPFDTMKSRAQAHTLGSEIRTNLWSGLHTRILLSFATMFVGSAAYSFAKKNI